MNENEAKQEVLKSIYWENAYKKWFLELRELSKKEKKRQRQLHPFSLDWEFRIDTREKKIYTKYIVKGTQMLPKAFLEEQGLTGNSFISALIKVNGKAADAFDYINGFCRYAVHSKHTYKVDDNISLTLQGKVGPLVSGNLDMSIPHLCYRDKEGMYRLGNKIGQEQSLLLIPEGWTIKNEETYKVDT